MTEQTERFVVAPGKSIADSDPRHRAALVPTVPVDGAGGDPAAVPAGTTAPDSATVDPSDGAAGLGRRLRALSRFVTRLGTRVPDERLDPARELIGRADERLEISDRHTVVALAGTTGSGKSSLFNALSGLDLSRVGVRRPTTSELHACVWDPAGAGELLDWLGVPDERRTARESALDGDEQIALRGLLLLDLPDFDSIDEAHREEVDRLVGVADLIIWVLDPQKYADRTVHERYLRSMAGRDSLTAVVLNQIDRLAPVDVERCAADLRRLLVDDGLPATTLYLTSARAGAGVSELRTVLAGVVADRQAAVRRLAADLTAVAADLAGLTGPAIDVEQAAPEEPLVDSLTELVGVPGLVDGAERDHRRRGLRATGWLFVRWALGGRDPKRRLEQERYDLDWLTPGTDDDLTGADGDSPGSSEPAVAQASEPPIDAGLAVRLHDYTGTAVAGLPDPWPRSVRAAVAEHSAELTERLGRVPARAAARPRPRWWGAMTAAQWLLGVCALGGLLWLLAAVLVPVSLPVPHLGSLPVPALLLVLGVVLGVLLAALSVPMVRSAAGTRRRQLAAELRTEVAATARACVVDPVRAELSAYRQARDAAEGVRGGR